MSCMCVCVCILYIYYIYIYIHTHTYIHIYVYNINIIYIYDGIMEHYSAIKKSETLPFAMMWMELESTMLYKQSTSEKDKYHMILLMCGI